MPKWLRVGSARAHRLKGDVALGEARLAAGAWRNDQRVLLELGERRLGDPGRGVQHGVGDHHQ